jgi:1,4-alpha-glucan branching enzyme
MGWMNDTLHYMQKNPVYRKHYHNNLRFGLMYAFYENFILPLSHDEVVHGKGSLISRMPGDEWQRFANLRCYYGFMWGYPGKKLLFMGGEIAQYSEWDADASIEWHLLEHSYHSGVQRLVRDLNLVYASLPALYQLDFEPGGFEWIFHDDIDNSVVSFTRWSENGEFAIIISNFTPVPRYGYQIGVPESGIYYEVINTDAQVYGGSGLHNPEMEAQPVPSGQREYSLMLTVPPLATCIILRKD